MRPLSVLEHLAHYAIHRLEYCTKMYVIHDPVLLLPRSQMKYRISLVRVLDIMNYDRT